MKVKSKKTFRNKFTLLVTLQTCYALFKPFQTNVPFFFPRMKDDVRIFSEGSKIGHLLEMTSSERSKEVL